MNNGKKIIFNQVRGGGYTATDAAGNTFYMTANQEVVTVDTVNGRQGMGWTAEEALKSTMRTEAETANYRRTSALSKAIDRIEAAIEIIQQIAEKETDEAASSLTDVKKRIEQMEVKNGTSKFVTH